MIMTSEALLASPDGVVAFLEREDKEELLYELSRTQLAWVAEHYGIEVESSMKKGAILLQVVKCMTESGVEEKKRTVQTEIDVLKHKARVIELELAEKKVDIEIEKIRIDEQEREREFELQKIGREREEKERERKEKERERAHELEEKERERVHELEEKERERAHELEVFRLKQGSVENNSFDVNSALKLVPIFKETEVAEFFIAFEKVANQLKWPKER